MNIMSIYTPLAYLVNIHLKKMSAIVGVDRRFISQFTGVYKTKTPFFVHLKTRGYGAPKPSINPLLPFLQYETFEKRPLSAYLGVRLKAQSWK